MPARLKKYCTPNDTSAFEPLYSSPGSTIGYCAPASLPQFLACTPSIALSSAHSTKSTPRQHMDKTSPIRHLKLDTFSQSVPTQAELALRYYFPDSGSVPSLIDHF
jgi:hypothetical protein